MFEPAFLVSKLTCSLAVIFAFWYCVSMILFSMTNYFRFADKIFIAQVAFSPVISILVPITVAIWLYQQISSSNGQLPFEKSLHIFNLSWWCFFREWQQMSPFFKCCLLLSILCKSFLSNSAGLIIPSSYHNRIDYFVQTCQISLIQPLRRCIWQNAFTNDLSPCVLND